MEQTMKSQITFEKKGITFVVFQDDEEKWSIAVKDAPQYGCYFTKRTETQISVHTSLLDWMMDVVKWVPSVPSKNRWKAKVLMEIPHFVWSHIKEIENRVEGEEFTIMPYYSEVGLYWVVRPKGVREMFPDLERIVEWAKRKRLFNPPIMGEKATLTITQVRAWEEELKKEDEAERKARQEKIERAKAEARKSGKDVLIERQAREVEGHVVFESLYATPSGELKGKFHSAE